MSLGFSRLARACGTLLAALACGPAPAWSGHALYEALYRGPYLHMYGRLSPLYARLQRALRGASP